MTDGFAKWRENTTTSHSRKRLGIYKSICTAYKHYLRTPTENTEDESIASKLIFIQNLPHIPPMDNSTQFFPRKNTRYTVAK